MTRFNLLFALLDCRHKVDGPMVKSLRVAVRGADDEGQDDWISPALPPLAMIKQV